MCALKHEGGWSDCRPVTRTTLQFCCSCIGSTYPLSRQDVEEAKKKIYLRKDADKFLEHNRLIGASADHSFSYFKLVGCFNDGRTGRRRVRGLRLVAEMVHGPAPAGVGDAGRWWILSTASGPLCSDDHGYHQHACVVGPPRHLSLCVVRNRPHMLPRLLPHLQPRLTAIVGWCFVNAPMKHHVN